MYLVKQEIPQLRATLYGVTRKPKNLPDWISYWQRPSTNQLRRLYNNAAIFIGPSWVEGWGLPGSEAAQCGAALCVSDVGGHREYAIHERTALLSPPGDPEAMAANVLKLVRADDLRSRIAREGHEYVQQFTWDRAVNAFERLLVETIRGARHEQ
jgi:glycosyltransferase involved in cell wall biosynthesis